MPRTFAVPGQRAELWVLDVDSGDRHLVLSTSDLLIEAPNWSPDGERLVVNGDGRLFAVPVGGGELTEIPLPGVPEINNDHVLSPDGATAYVSAEDGHLYAAPVDGSSAPRRVTADRAPGFHHYLHGVSPDGATLAYIGQQRYEDGSAIMNVHLVPVDGGQDVQLTDDAFPDDGAEFSPDGQWVYFNSERASSTPGHAQLFRISVDGDRLEQLTDDERVNWFPHPTPDGRRLAYISFPPGTLGHPADLDVLLRLREEDGTVRDLVALFGGQGPMNVPSWPPDGTRLAYVAYPVDAA